MRHVLLKSFPSNDIAERWHAMNADAPQSTHYVTPNYFCDPYIAADRFAVLAFDGDEAVAALTGTVDGRHLISGMYCRPQLVFRNNCARDDAIDALMRGLEELAEHRGSVVEIHSWDEQPRFISHRMTYRPSGETDGVVMLDLRLGADVLFSQFSQTRRNEIRKAVKQSIVLVKSLDTEAELVELYNIYCDWNSRKGHVPGSIDQMRTGISQLDNRRVFIATIEGKVVAGSFYRFCRGGVVEYAANVSLTEYQKYRPNDLIGWSAIQWACEGGYSQLCMGGSHLFLRRFGGEIVATHRYRSDRTLLKLAARRERAMEIGGELYRRLPERVRATVRRLRGS